MEPLVIRRVEGPGELAAFVDLPRALYRGDPCYVPPLTFREVAGLDPARNPFFRHGRSAFWAAWRGGRPAGRISATVDQLHLAMHADATGFFGHFEAADHSCAHALLDAAAAWLAAQGMRRIRGPIDLTSNHRCGLLVEGFGEPPTVMMNYNPPTYEEMLTSWGLQRVQDLLVFLAVYTSVRAERIYRVGAIALRRAVAIERPLDKRRYEEEAALLLDLYNRCWERNWGYAPMTRAEFLDQAKAFRPVLDPRFGRIVERRGEPVGFILALPDINPAVRACDGRLLPFGFVAFLRALRRVTRARVVTLGILPEHRGHGLDAALIGALITALHEAGYVDAELSWVLEGNLPMVKPLQEMAGPPTKRYRLYERALGAKP